MGYQFRSELNIINACLGVKIWNYWGIEKSKADLKLCFENCWKLLYSTIIFIKQIKGGLIIPNNYLEFVCSLVSLWVIFCEKEVRLQLWMLSGKLVVVLSWSILFSRVMLREVAREMHGRRDWKICTEQRQWTEDKPMRYDHTGGHDRERESIVTEPA